ncbi:MAG TPA: ABC transporter substrate-binding protein [Acidimicrobiales bacterium]
MTRKPTAALLGLLLVGSLFAAACGDDDGDDGADAGRDDTSETGEGAEELTPIKVGILPIAGLAPLWYGIEEGYFEEEGLEVTTEIGEGGAAFTPAVLNGEYQFAIGEYLSVLQARENDVPIQVVSNLTNGSSSPDDHINGLLVKADSGIDGVEDLAGTTIAVNGLNGIDDVTVKAILDDAGVDPDSVSFVEVPFPDMLAAVESGQVDVAAEPEPFVTLGEESGLVTLLDPYYEALPGLPLGLVFGAEDWLEENPDVAAAFHRALVRSIEAAADEEAMGEVIMANTDTTPELLEAMALDDWAAEVDREKLSQLADLAITYGALEDQPDLDELIWTPPDADDADGDADADADADGE